MDEDEDELPNVALVTLDITAAAIAKCFALFRNSSLGDWAVMCNNPSDASCRPHNDEKTSLIDAVATELKDLWILNWRRDFSALQERPQVSTIRNTRNCITRSTLPPSCKLLPCLKVNHADI